MARILILDDEEKMVDMCRRILSKDGHILAGLSNPNEALELMKNKSFDIILSDMVMPGMDGMAFMNKCKEMGYAGAFVFMTAFSTIEGAVEAIRSGAQDYVQKPFRPQELRLIIGRIEKEQSLLAENKYLMAKQEEETELIFASKKMKDLVELAKKIASADITVLITGPSGSGKDKIARLIHSLSERGKKPLITVNCGAIPDELIESELFGHVEGAFTSAIRDRRGMFKLADNGTLFLDEIGELKPDLQVKLLRVLEDNKIRPVGSEEWEKVNIRIIAATNRDLEGAVKEGHFREDLFYRLNAMRLHLPSLKERPDDIMPLAEYFSRVFATKYRKKSLDFHLESQKKLINYSWPGNIRELRHIVERAIIMARDLESDKEIVEMIMDNSADSGNVGILTGECGHLGLSAQDSDQIGISAQKAGDMGLLANLEKDEKMAVGGDLTLSQLEKEHISRILKRCDGNKAQAAQILGIDKSTLWRKIKQWEESAVDS